MKVAVSPQILALCTAPAWGIGGFFEKIDPVMGILGMGLAVGGIVVLSVRL